MQYTEETRSESKRISSQASSRARKRLRKNVIEGKIVIANRDEISKQTLPVPLKRQTQKRIRIKKKKMFQPKLKRLLSRTRNDNII